MMDQCYIPEEVDAGSTDEIAGLQFGRSYYSPITSCSGIHMLEIFIVTTKMRY